MQKRKITAQNNITRKTAEGMISPYAAERSDNQLDRKVRTLRTTSYRGFCEVIFRIINELIQLRNFDGEILYTRGGEIVGCWVFGVGC